MLDLYREPTLVPGSNPERFIVGPLRISVSVGSWTLDAQIVNQAETSIHSAKAVSTEKVQ